MKFLVRVVCGVFVAMLSFHAVKAQVYVGGGWSLIQFSPSGLDETQGFGLMVQRQLDLKRDRFSLSPTLQANVLNQRIDNDVFAELYVSIGLASHLNYDLIRWGKFSFTPFIGPSVNWVMGLRNNPVEVAPRDVNFVRVGVDAGAALSYAFSEDFSLKFIPLIYTFGNQNYVQGNFFTLLFQIK
ncbi:hypothetical protein [Penaeicola halotolerans]|uniref:hypothetical protein n=1 Tax=Penaeicola halotolerans TaxID=2793196 RepID=UPI001CF8A50B|nr:hypothetical protein [Penaeicola halotolerans]